MNISLQELYSEKVANQAVLTRQLFRLGLALLDHLLNEELPIPVSFALLETKSVR